MLCACFILFFPCGLKNGPPSAATVGCCTSQTPIVITFKSKIIMPDSTTFHVPIFILLSFVASGLTQRQCFWPDNTLAVNYLPCQDQPNTSCCFAGEACLDSGLCYGALGLVYRGACTGSDYAGSACPQQCVGSKSFIDAKSRIGRAIAD